MGESVSKFLGINKYYCRYSYSFCKLFFNQTILPLEKILKALENVLAAKVPAQVSDEDIGNVSSDVPLNCSFDAPATWSVFSLKVNGHLCALGKS